MAEFIITTNDSVYSYTSNQSVNISFDLQNNNKFSDTQGYLRKKQVGRARVKATVRLADTKATIEANILPMLTYPDDVNVTFDRNIPNKNTATARFVLEDYKVVREFDGGDEIEIDLTMTEVLGTI